MKSFRPLLAGAAVIAVLVLLALSLAYTSGFQTWAVRRAVNAQPGIQGDVGRVSAGFQSITVSSLRLQGDGYRLTLPSAEIKLPVLSALREKVAVRRLVAKGWTLDLTVPSGLLSATPQPHQALAGYLAFLTSAEAQPRKVPVPTAGFSGIFDQLGLPVDLSIDSLELEGEVIFPIAPGQAAGRARVTLTGGQLRAGREGRFTLMAAVAVDDPGALVNQLDSRSELVARMDTPRTFDRVEATIVATASGVQAPTGARLTVDLAARRNDDGEDYKLILRSAVRTLAEFRADFPAGAPALTGSWLLDTRSADLTPFVLGRPLPMFELHGQGSCVLDRRFSEVQAVGQIDAQAERLEVVMPELRSVGPVRLAASFDLATVGRELHVKSLQVSLAGAQPVARLEVRQGLEWNRQNGELRVANPDAELLRVSLEALPLGWIQPFVPDLTLTGDPLRGEVLARARGGRFSVRTDVPLTSQRLSAALSGRPLIKEIDVSLAASADYTTLGWQAEISGFSAQQGPSTLFSLRAIIGQAMGRDQPIKATGGLTIDLPAVLGQPAFAGQAPLSSGQAKVDFTAQLSAKDEIGLQLELNELALDGQALPTIKGELRADRHADGRIDARLPLTFSRAGRESDLELAAAIKPVGDQHDITAQLSSRIFHVEDAQILGALVPTGPTREGTVPTVGTPGPAWSGYTGRIGLDFKKIHYAPNVIAHDVVGSVRIGPSALVFDGISAALGEGGMLKLTGQIAFDALQLSPYALASDLALTQFDPAPLFRALNPVAPPPVEGRFDLTTRLTGRARDLGGLVDAAGGNLNLSSRGGTLRAFSVDIADSARAGTRIASVAGIIGLATGDERVLKYSDRLRAASELTGDLASLDFDQLTVQLERTPENHYVIKDLSVISPTIRLLGAGIIEHQPGVSIWSQPLSLQVQLGARDRMADNLRVLKLLADRADALGYTPLAEQLMFDGSLENVGTSKLRDLIVRALNGT